MIDHAAYGGFVDDLVGGRRRACRERVAALLDAGTRVRAIYDQLFQPALDEVGDRWQAGTLSVATEHLATHIVAQTDG